MRRPWIYVLLAVGTALVIGALFVNPLLLLRDFLRARPVKAQLETTTTTLPACTRVPVIVSHHDGCLRVARGTPHLDPGTPVAVVIQEDRRLP
jgi:hypothetical protein